MLTFLSGNLFDTDAAAIVNTVNCVGAMGAGIALGVKNRWPATYTAYRRDCGIGLSCAGGSDSAIGPQRHQAAPPCCAPGLTCQVHRVRPGGAIVRPTLTPGPIRFVIDLPTKRHWHGPSLLSDVAAGIPALAAAITRLALPSVAIPPLGCGNGGLDWTQVRSLLIAGLAPLAAVDIRIYAAGPTAPSRAPGPPRPTAAALDDIPMPPGRW